MIVPDINIRRIFLAALEDLVVNVLDGECITVEPEDRRFFIIEPDLYEHPPGGYDIDNRPFHQRINDKHSRRRRK